MKNNYTLLVEDNSFELDVAIRIANSLGIETKVASDFNYALDEINDVKPSAIVSDLFFPAGNMDQAKYIQQILPNYENYLKSFKPLTDGPLVNVLQFIFGEATKESGKEKVFDEIILPYFLKNDSSEIIEMTRDAYFGIERYSTYLKLKNYIDRIKKGDGLPYGFFISEEAKKLKIPCYIVTSTNHHDISFEPIRNIISSRYSDDLIDGHKNWKPAFQYVLENLKGGKE